jgi:predicted ATPase
MRDLYIRSMSLREMPPADSWLSALPVVRHLAAEGLTFHRQVTFLVGENGAGKSTLIEALAISQGFNAEGGSRNFNFTTAATHSDLHSYLRVTRGAAYPRTGYFLRAESFYNVATNIDELGVQAGYGHESLHSRSHGESFLTLAEVRFHGKGLYLLDEPEAALSPTGMIRFIRRMHELVEDDSQFIISTHSPMLITYPDAEIFQLSEKGIETVPFKETSHYRTTLRFLQNPEQAMADILGYEIEDD